MLRNQDSEDSDRVGVVGIVWAAEAMADHTPVGCQLVGNLAFGGVWGYLGANGSMVSPDVLNTFAKAERPIEFIRVR